MAHLCHAKNCKITVPPRMFMCRKHWFKLSAPIRHAIWEHYVPGQEARKDPSAEYLAIAQVAINYVAAHDN